MGNASLNACVGVTHVAGVGENISCGGKEQVSRSREMHWMVSIPILVTVRLPGGHSPTVLATV